MTSELEEKEQQERLREAAALGDLQELQKLVQSGVNINSQNEINGWTCLHWACKRNHGKIISYLLDHGADKDIVTNKGETPVDLTSRKHIKKIMGVEENEIEELKEDSELPIVPNYLANPPFPYVYSKKTDSLLDASKISQTENNASSFTSQCVPNASFSSLQTKMNFKPLSLHTEERCPAVAHNGNMHAALEPPTVVHNGPVCQSSMPQNQSLFSPVMTPQQQKSEHPGHMASFQPLFFTGAFPFNTQELVLKVRIQNIALGEHDFIEVEMDRQELTYQELLRVCCLELGVHAEQVERIRKLPNTLLRKECETYEKCCPNVCGTNSCVAARYMDVKGKKGPVGMPRAATCDHFMCAQQGSECDIWDGQPVCKCRDRCEKEPSFTCASDGLTYYNKCFMDAEACTKGTMLNVVTCKYHLTWPNTSPVPLETTAHPTTASLGTTVIDVVPPGLVNNPTHKSVHVGETVSFVCDVTGKPKPEITWEKQRDGKANIIMKPNHVRDNVVVTNIAQLVIYNTQLQDAGIYTCTAQNTAGLLRADFPLSIITGESSLKGQAQNKTHFPTDECLKQPNSEDCGEEQTRWYYEAKKNNCYTFTFGNCNSNLNHFESYESCMLTCMNGPVNICNLPALQGPCKAYEPRWAYSSIMKQCQSFIYGGCGGNDNNFESKDICDNMCPFPKNQHCKVCKPRQKLVTSFCKSDFVILGRITELTRDQDSGHALVTVEEVLKDEKMGLKFMGREPLEITLLNMDWNCPCPNMTTLEGQLIIMGDVHNGMAVLKPNSFVGTSSARRVRKLREVIHKKTCELLKDFLGLNNK